jgi:hypothetical protein
MDAGQTERLSGNVKTRLLVDMVGESKDGKAKTGKEKEETEIDSCS